MKLITMIILILASQVQANSHSATTQVIQMTVTEKGFEPSAITVDSGTSVTLQITRKTDSTCATQIQVPSKKIKKDLPLGQMISVNLGQLKKGEITFGCGMNMMEGGVISVK